MIVNHLFPTPVSFFKYEGMTKKEKIFLIKQKERANVGNTSSANNNILNSKNLLGLKKFIDGSLKQYFQEIYKPKNKIDIYITQSWCNYTKEGQYHHSHAHPNSFISGVFYIQADKAKDKIYFLKNEYQRIKIAAAEYNSFNSESWWFETGENDLVLFPSNLTHKVEKVVGKDRISLSFNTFLKGFMGENLNLTGLHL